MPDEEYDYPHYEEDYQIDGVGFADPGGESALRAATKDNPRNLPCPTCHWPNRLTPIDVQRGYQCDSCANAAETGQDINYYDGEDDDDGQPTYIYSIVMLVQVQVEASSSEVAIEKATSSKDNWETWDLADTPVGPEATVINVNP